MDIHTIIIIIAGVLGVIFWLKDDQKKALVALVVLISVILLKQIGI